MPRVHYQARHPSGLQPAAAEWLMSDWLGGETTIFTDAMTDRMAIMVSKSEEARKWPRFKTLSTWGGGG